MNHIEIYHAVKKDILTLKLRPGQLISENETAKQYNVSRTPVKAAFTRLESEGFVEVVPQKGTFVTLVDCRHVRDILYMRYVLEVDMAKLSFNSSHYTNLIDQLSQNIEEQEFLVKHDTPCPESFYELDTQFHALLFECLGYKGIWSIIQANQVHYPRFRLLDTHMFGRYDELQLQHSEILAAIKDKDIKQLDRCLYHHLHQYLILLSKSPPSEYRDYMINW